jgi:hypothetical protein
MRCGGAPSRRLLVATTAAHRQMSQRVGTERCKDRVPPPLKAEPVANQLVREPGSITDRTFEIAFLDAGVEAYVFTFG